MIVIGAGRVGRGLAALDPQLRLIDRTRGWDALRTPGGEPIVLAVRNDDLGDVVRRVPAHRHEDLVFTQNGMLRDYLAEAGLADATRGLLFFAVAKRGDRPVPGGESPFWGRHAGAVSAWMRGLELPACELDEASFAALELEKLIWNCAFGLCCEAFEASVGAVVQQHGEALRTLVAELHALGERELQVELAFEPLLERLCAYSLSIAEYRGAVKEWPWRNGWFVERGRIASMPMPKHDELLAKVGR